MITRERPLKACVRRHLRRFTAVRARITRKCSDGTGLRRFSVLSRKTSIESIEHGPTQYVRGSHYSGRNPNDQDHPEFEGQGPTSVFCKAGDIYLQDPQCWHRGAPNRSDRTRYILQSQYAAPWAFWRFSLCNRVPVPENALQTASDRLLNLLGRIRPNSL